MANWLKKDKIGIQFPRLQSFLKIIKKTNLIQIDKIAWLIGSVETSL